MPRPKQTHCSRGHAIAEVGRNSSGNCRACAALHQRRYCARRLGEIRAYKVDHGCTICGYSRTGAALDFHHPDPAAKEFAIGRNLNRSRESMWAEIAKCVILCRNCHAEIHSGLVTLE